MNELCDEYGGNINDQAYSDFVTAMGREPTEDELDYEVESLMDRYR